MTKKKKNLREIFAGIQQKQIASKYCILDSFVDYDGYSISSKGFLPTVVDKMVIELNSPIPVYFSLLIPRMSTFTLAISCLTTSNFP